MAIPKTGDTIEFHLTTRIKNSIILKDESRKKSSPEYLYEPGHIPLTRVVVTYDIAPIISAERKQLTDALWLAKSCQDLYLVPYFEVGLKELERREEAFGKLFADAKSGMGMEGNEALEVPKVLQDPAVDYICTYQAVKGDNVFLLPLNFKCLLDEYERYEYLPAVIKAPVIEIDHFRLDSLQQKKYK